MKYSYPTLIHSLKGYGLKDAKKDIKAGILVAVIALPLSIALAISSGVRPENGLYSAIIGGCIVALLSGSSVQIGGVTAATVMTVSTIIGMYGLTGLAVATMMAGIVLIIMGLLRFGNLLKFIPVAITTGFTAGIAAGIVTSQMKEFLGLHITEEMPVRIIEKWMVYMQYLDTISLPSVMVGLCSIALLIVIPKLTQKIPHTLAMIVVMTLAVQIFSIPVSTVASVYGEIPATFPKFQIPHFEINMIQDLFPYALTLAILIGIVSLLSCVVTDGLTGKKHHSNTELIAQGVANLACGFFGAVPVAGAVARSANLYKNGGRTQVGGLVHSVVILLILLCLMPLIGFIPMTALAALLLVVAWNMINWNEIAYTCKRAPRSDAIILFITTFIAISVDLMSAVEVGMLLTSLLFMRRMAEVTSVAGWKYASDQDGDTSNENLREVPPNTRVYEICGPLFFAASEKLSVIVPEEGCKCLILRMRSVTAIDATAMHRLEHILEQCERNQTVLLLSHVNKQPLAVFKKAGFDQAVGEAHFCEHLEEALQKAKRVESLK